MNKYIVYFQNNINIQVEAINVEAAKIAAFTRMAMAIGDKINVLSIEKIEQIIVVYTKDGQGGYKFHNESVDIVNQVLEEKKKQDIVNQALKEGAWFKVCNLDYTEELVFRKDLYLEYDHDLEKYIILTNGRWYYVHTYGSDWALTKEELED